MRTRHLKLFLFCFGMTIAITTSAPAQDQVDYAQRGEGIYKLLQRNGITPSTAVLAEFREINANKLIDGNGLKRGVAYSLPSTARSRTYPIFGSDYEEVSTKSDALTGCVYYVISGHGGRDPGAVGKRNGKKLYEDEYAYDVALRLSRRLIEEGATVYVLSRDDEGIRDVEYFPPDSDERHLGGAYIGRGQKARLKQRVDDINRLQRKHGKALLQRVVELHVDSYKSSRQVDVDFYYHSRRGKITARTLQKTFDTQYDLIRPNRGYRGRVVQRSRLYTLRNAGPVTTLIELGNINHPGDQLRIIQPDNRQFIADWLTLGFIEDAKTSTR